MGKNKATTDFGCVYAALVFGENRLLKSPQREGVSSCVVYGGQVKSVCGKKHPPSLLCRGKSITRRRFTIGGVKLSFGPRFTRKQGEAATTKTTEQITLNQENEAAIFVDIIMNKQENI